jgi:hypothetical protein
MDYCLPAGYRSRLEPEYFIDEGYEGVWQPDVYPEAAALAARLGVRRIVGVGCGTGKELAALHPSFEVVGLDAADNIARCRERYEFGTWLELDLDGDVVDVPEPKDAVLVCKGLIERLVQPERLLTLLAGAVGNGAAAVLLSTPDRERMSKPGDLGPPDNPAHVREWTSAELVRFMDSVGLAGHFGLTRSTELPPYMTSALAVLPGQARDRQDAIDAWWEERARWQCLVEEQDRTILLQHAWIAELRSTRDWLAQQRQAWEATAAAKEAELADRDNFITQLETTLASALDQDGRADRAALRWALLLATPVARVARRSRIRRS